MNYRDIIVVDFETGSRNPHKTQPTQVAAVAIHGRKLTVQPGGYFNSEIRPILDDEKAVAAGLDPIEDEALAVTKKERKALARAPLPKTVWSKFTNFVNKYNFKKTPYYAPVMAGYNIHGFDMHIVERMCAEYGPIDKKRGEQVLFNRIHKIDLMETVWLWFENNSDVKSISMDSMRDLLGVPKDNAHDALQDVKDTANLLIAFMKLYRKMSPKIKFEKAFADGRIHL